MLRLVNSRFAACTARHLFEWSTVTLRASDFADGGNKSWDRIICPPMREHAKHLRIVHRSECEYPQISYLTATARILRHMKLGRSRPKKRRRACCAVFAASLPSSRRLARASHLQLVRLWLRALSVGSCMPARNLGNQLSQIRHLWWKFIAVLQIYSLNCVPCTLRAELVPHFCRTCSYKLHRLRTLR